MKSQPRVAFFTLRDSFMDGDRCFYDRSNAKLVEALKMQYGNFTFITYTDHVQKRGYNHEIKNLRLLTIPFRNTFLNGLIHAVYIFKLLKKIDRDHDVIILQYPFKTFFAPLILRSHVICHICSNLLSAADNPMKYGGLQKKIAVVYARIFHYFNGLMFKKPNVKVITNGLELADLYKAYNPIPVISSSIQFNQIIDPKYIKKRESIFKILFVGRPSLEKGFDTIVNAFKLLAPTEPIELLFVGFTKREFQSLSNQHGIESEERIKFYGHVPFSDELFAFYRSADILVLPSRSEGTPRVLIEARAFGCPVVATRVGGIPSSIEDGVDGLLFESGDHQALAHIIADLIHNEAKRMSLAVKGVERVKNMTVEKFADCFINIIDQQTTIHGE